MGLTRMVSRIAAVRALTGRTIAEGRVFDSTIQPIDVIAKGERYPVIVITTDNETSEITGRDLTGGTEDTEFVVEIAVTQGVTVTSGEVTLEVPTTDNGLERLLDILEFQVKVGLLREATGWSRAWKLLVPSISRTLSRRGATSEDGVRFAARQIVINCQMIGIPPEGEELRDDDAWEVVLGLMEADEHLAGTGALVRSLLVGRGAALPDWQRQADALGILHEASRKIGLGPVFDEDGASEATTLVQINVDDEEHDDDMVVTEQNADDQGV